MMHGLINRTIQGFLRDTYGVGLWGRVARRAGITPEGFEAMLHYEDNSTEAVLAAAAQELDRARETILEDIGTWLVSSATGQPLRRLMRFGGVDFTDFLHSLEDMPGRARLALPDLELPVLELREPGPGHYLLISRGLPGFGHVLAGIVQAMADDYGALVVLDRDTPAGPDETISIRLVIADHAQGRQFALAGDH